MTKEQIGERLQEALVSVNNVLKYAHENKVDVTLEIQRKASTTVDIVESIQLKKISQNAELEFETKQKGQW